MATIPVQTTLAVGAVLTSAVWNSNVRDAVNFVITPPLFVGQQTVAQGLTNNAWTSINLDSEDIDRDSGHSTISNTSRYVSQTQGWYDVEGSGSSSVSAAGFRACTFAVNGGTRSCKEQIGPSPSFATWITIAGKRFMNAGDYIEIQMFLNVSGLSTQVADDGNPRLQVRWVST